MDLQTALSAMCAADRQEKMKDSPQLTLGELILKLEAVADRGKRVFFDFGNFTPTGIDSWRSIYAELSLHFSDDPISTPTVDDLLGMLSAVNGKTLEGYKGGDFKMGRQTPIWVANWGESGVPKYKEGAEDYPSVGVVDVIDGEKVIIATQVCESY